MNIIPNLLIFILCLVPWIVFYFFDPSLNQFNFPTKIHVNDWHKELEYINVLKQAVMQGILPLNVPDFQDFFNQISSKGEFLGMPIYPLSPLIISLYFLDPMQFHIFNHFLMIGIGFFGCLLIKRDFSLSILAFFFLVITFNLYGGFVSKIAAYGPSQLGYYFSIFIIWILLRISQQGEFKSKNQFILFSIILSLSLSLMLYQGSLHYFVEWITFLIFWGLFNFRYLKFLFASAFLTIFFSAFRLLPAALMNGSASNVREVGGYGFNPEFFLQTFISIRGITDFPAFAWWENSNYISIVGFMLILIFGVYIYFLSKQDLAVKGLRIFFAPLLIVFIISFKDFRIFFVPEFVPLLNIESLTTRYFFIVVLFLIAISSLNFDKFYSTITSLSLKILLWFMAVVHFLFLMLNTQTWSLQLIQNELFQYGGLELEQSLLVLQTNLKIINEENSLWYVQSLNIGFWVSSISLLFLILYLFYFYVLNKNKISQ